MEQVYDARFERIEKALEILAVASAGNEGHAVALFHATEALAAGQKQLLTAQILMVDSQRNADERIAKLAEAQTKTELAMQETQGKLDALIHMWDDWIRERRNGGPKNGPPKP